MHQVRESKTSDVEQVMTVDQLADYLQMNRQTIYKLVQRKKIPFAKVGKSLRFHKQAIDQWLMEESLESIR